MAGQADPCSDAAKRPMTTDRNGSIPGVDRVRRQTAKSGPSFSPFDFPHNGHSLCNYELAECSRSPAQIARRELATVLLNGGNIHRAGWMTLVEELLTLATTNDLLLGGQ
jgi:hypothetical protein